MTERVLYSETRETFVDDVLHNRVGHKMLESAHRDGLYIGKSEVAAWHNNAPRIKDLLELGRVGDVQVAFEYLMPYNRTRIDCMLYGRGEDGRENAVHIELKQWGNDTVKALPADANFSAADEPAEDEKIEALTGGAYRTVAHPSQQVRGYDGYLRNFVEVFSVHAVDLSGVAYCYNYERDNPNKPTVLFDEKYTKLIKEYPLYAGDRVDDLAKALHRLLVSGDGLSVFNKVANSPIRPCSKLLDEAARLVHDGKTEAFALVQDQIVAKNMIMDRIRRLGTTKQKSVLLVKGGPGTGKTVIALHLLAELAKSGRIRNVRFATKSKPLLEGVKNCLPRHSPVEYLFTNVNAFLPYQCEEDQFDVVLIDEAHRIQKSPNYQYMKSYMRTDLSMVDMVIRASKICVMFIDDKQAIRGLEIGSSKMIREAADRFGAYVDETELKSQFRCNGSDNYLDWLDKVLYNEKCEVKFSLDDFDFRVMDSPQAVYDAICAKNDPAKKVTARLMAGFCWPWSDQLGVDGDLQREVSIGDFAMPWETKDSIRPRPRNRPEWYKWAYDPRGIEQVGCIYTAQGFEFDYAGVILGPDIVYRNGAVVTDYDASKDPVLKRGREGFDGYVRNIYRVLMSRGMRGCYVYCCDKALANYLRQMAGQSTVTTRPEILHEVGEALRYHEYLPFYTIAAACGKFGAEQRVEKPIGWVRISGRLAKNENLFVVRATGHSMEPKIKDGEYCVFEYRQGAEPDNNDIVLAEHSDEIDDETRGAYSIKKYVSEGGRGILHPINPDYKDIVLDPTRGYRIVGVLRENCRVIDGN